MDCNFCERKFVVRAKLKNHINNFHENRGKSFKCDMCDRFFLTKRLLAYHKRNRHEEKTGKHKCKDCSESFCSIRKYSIHRRIHTGIKDYLDITNHLFYSASLTLLIETIIFYTMLFLEHKFLLDFYLF